MPVYNARAVILNRAEPDESLPCQLFAGVGYGEFLEVCEEAWLGLLNQNAFAEIRYPWASSQPRFSLQAAIEAALAGTMSPEQALKQAQKETDDWLAQQAATPTP